MDFNGFLNEFHATSLLSAGGGVRKLKRGKKATNKMPTVNNNLEQFRRTSRLQQEACMQLRCRPKATNIMPSTNNSPEIIQASEL